MVGLGLDDGEVIFLLPGYPLLERPARLPLIFRNRLRNRRNPVCGRQHVFRALAPRIRFHNQPDRIGDGKFFHVLGEVGEPSEIVMVLNKDSSSLTDALNAALKELRESGKYDEILKKWLVAE